MHQSLLYLPGGEGTKMVREKWHDMRWRDMNYLYDTRNILRQLKFVQFIRIKNHFTYARSDARVITLIHSNCNNLQGDTI